MAQVIVPGRKESALEKIARGLQIAGSVYGIAQAREKLDVMKMQKEKMAKGESIDALEEQKKQLEIERMKREAGEQEKISRGIVTGARKAELVGKGFEFGRGPVIGTDPLGQEIRAASPQLLEMEKREQQREADLAKVAEEIAREDTKSKLARTDKIRNNYDKASKDTLATIRGFRNVESAATTTSPTGVTDLSLLVGYMKTIDPGSVVREGELITASKTGGIPDTLKNLYKNWTEGSRLTEEQRREFYSEARRLTLFQLQEQLKTDRRYEDIATAGGLPAEEILDERFSDMYEKLLKPLPPSGYMGDTGEPRGRVPQADPGITKETDEPEEGLMDKFLNFFEGFGGQK